MVVLVDDEDGGYSRDIVETHEVALPALERRHIDPVETILLYRLLPSGLVGIERNADNLQALIVELIVEFTQRGIADEILDICAEELYFKQNH